MKKNYTSFCAFLLSTVLLSSCERGPELTPLTQEGKNTFSCKVNGEVWIPNGRSDLVVSIKALSGGFFRNLPTDSTRIWISAVKGDNEIHLYLKEVKAGTQYFNLPTPKIGYTFNPENYAEFRESRTKGFSTNAQYTGSATLLRADTLTGIISGTFEFTAGISTGETVRVTEGRFDINTRTLNLPPGY